MDQTRVHSTHELHGAAKFLVANALAPRTRAPRRVTTRLHIDVTYQYGRYRAKFRGGNDYWADNIAEAIGDLLLEYGSTCNIIVKRPKVKRTTPKR